MCGVRLLFAVNLFTSTMTLLDVGTPSSAVSLQTLRRTYPYRMSPMISCRFMCCCHYGEEDGFGGHVHNDKGEV